jgi:hypothetical protein
MMNQTLLQIDNFLSSLGSVDSNPAIMNNNIIEIYAKIFQKNTQKAN